MSTGLILPQVSSPGLVFREWRKTDASGLASYMTLPAYNRWLAVKTETAGQVEALVARHLKRQQRVSRRKFRMCAIDVGSRKPVADGFINLLGGGAAEIGWGVAPDMWNCGVGTRMAEVLCAMAIERLDAEQVWCKVMSPNLASACVARKTGFTLNKSVDTGPAGLNRSVQVDIYRLTADEYFERGYAA